MPFSPESFYQAPNRLAPLYSRFGVDRGPWKGSLLLTGHSHQAWPDCAREGLLECYDDAACHVDKKWDRAFAKARRVEQGWAKWLDDEEGTCTLASNTHELLVRFLSALPLQERPRLVTTNGEFHSIRRQLDRLEEEGLEIVRVDSEDADTLAERLAAEVDDHTAAVLVSKVLFGSGRIVSGLDHVFRATQQHGAELLVDVYHALGAIPFSLREEGLLGAYAVGGGYKYCQLGEGNSFLRVPADCQLRPVITGWFAEFHLLSQTPGDSVPYGEGANRFAGATYDPTSQYRAARVLDFFEEHGLDGQFLRTVSQHQIHRLAKAFDQLDADPAVLRRSHEVPLDQYGAFLVLHSPVAGKLSRALEQRGVATDYRGQALRFGPAPYLSDEQLLAAMERLGEVLRERS